MDKTATVITQSGSLNVRASANTSGKIVGKLPKGARVTIIGDGADGWLRIRYGDVVGYASAQYLQIDEGPAAPDDNGTGTVNDETGTVNDETSTGNNGTSIGNNGTNHVDNGTTAIENEEGVRVTLRGKWRVEND